MPRVVGIDPGTVSFDVLGLEDGEAFLDRSLSTSEVARRPETLLGVLQAALPLDLIAGPSGYGLPLVPIEAVGEREINLLYLAQPGDESPIGGLRTLVRLLREARLPVIFTPGVIHLPTVPAHRKVNRIDLGTADKVCAVAAASPPREILLSGRLSRIPGFREPVVAALSRLGPVRCLDVGTKVKEAARGAALIADGLAGGRYRELVEVMRLREAQGTVLDHLYLTGAEEVRSWAQGPARS